MADEMNIRVTGEHCSDCTQASRAVHTDQRSIVRGASTLAKRYLYSHPDPFAVLSIDAHQSHTTNTAKKTLNPSWDETFNVLVTSLTRCC
jgi:Ca2+-dependent lipid-binding protein